MRSFTTFVTLAAAVSSTFASSVESIDGALYARKSKSTSTSSGSFNPAKFNSPTDGPPPEYFAGDASIPAVSIAKAALKLKDVAAKYRNGEGSSMSNLYSDWTKFKDSSAFVFTSNMDVDCDGLNEGCKGNGDGQGQTTFGKLSAYAVPFIVIPDNFQSSHRNKGTPPNAVSAVICDGKLFYGILGDTNGDKPYVTGEASWLMAKTCFPDGHISGANGHAPNDVTYIVFDEEFKGLNENYILKWDDLKAAGNRLMNALAQNLKLSSGSSSGGDGGDGGDSGNSTDTPTNTGSGSGSSSTHCKRQKANSKRSGVLAELPGDWEFVSEARALEDKSGDYEYEILSREQLDELEARGGAEALYEEYERAMEVEEREMKEDMEARGLEMAVAKAGVPSGKRAVHERRARMRSFLGHA